MGFSIDVSEQDGLSVVKVYGEIDVCTAPLLEDALCKLIDSGRHTLSLDLAACSYVDSEGIKVLINAMLAVSDDGELVVSGVHGAVERVFEIAGMDAYLRIVPSRSGAHLSP